MLKFSNITTHVLRSGDVMLSYDRINVDDLVKIDISVSISSAIAAYSRVEMTHLLTKYHNNIYAVNTDGKVPWIAGFLLTKWIIKKIG